MSSSKIKIFKTPCPLYEKINIYPLFEQTREVITVLKRKAGFLVNNHNKLASLCFLKLFHQRTQKMKTLIWQDLFMKLFICIKINLISLVFLQRHTKKGFVLVYFNDSELQFFSQVNYLYLTFILKNNEISKQDNYSIFLYYKYFISSWFLLMLNIFRDINSFHWITRMNRTKVGGEQSKHHKNLS